MTDRAPAPVRASTCAAFLEELVAGHVDAETSQHLARCRACQELITMTRAIRDDLESVPYAAGRKPAWIQEAHERRRRRRRRHAAIGFGMAVATAVSLWFGAGAAGRWDGRDGAPETTRAAPSTRAIAATRAQAPEEPIERPAWVRRFLRRLPNPPVDRAQCWHGAPESECVAVSSYQPTREAAQQAATDRLLDAVIDELEHRIDSPRFDDNSRTFYRGRVIWWFPEIRVSVARKPGSRDARRRALADARRRARLALSAAAPSPIVDDLHREEFDRASGEKEVKIFVRARRHLRDLEELYTAERDWGGTRVMTAFPLLALSHEDFEGGVLVTGKGTPRLPHHSVITAINGRPVRSLADLRELSPKDEIEFASRGSLVRR